MKATSYSIVLLCLLVAQPALVAAGGLPAPMMLPEIDSSDLAPPFQLTIAGDALIFSGLGPERWQIWSLRDGTAAPLGVPCPTGGGAPFLYVQLPGTTVAYISEHCWLSGTFLGSIDSVTGVTQPVVSSSSPMPTYAYGLARFGDRALLTYENGTLWSTDGTDAGTVIVQDFEGNAAFVTPVGEWAMIAANGRPWRTDGTTEGTFQLASSVAPERGTAPWPAQDLVPLYVPLGKRVVFYGRSADEGLELWSSDGSADGTARITTFRPGSQPVGVGPLVACRGIAYFASDGITPAGDQYWSHLWRSDGTQAGTYPIGEDSGGGWRGLTANPIGCLGSSVVVLHWDLEADTQYLAISDGTVTGTHPLLETGYNVVVDYPAREYHGWLFLVMVLDTQNYSRELWATNGTPAGTFRTGEIAPNFGDPNPRELTGFGDSLYFVANDGTHDDEIWRIVVDPALVFRDGFESATLTAWNQPAS